MKNLGIIFSLFFLFAGCVELEELEMITKVVKEPVSIDVQFIPSSECEFGGYVTQITIEGQNFLSPPICNGAPGEKGDPGEDGKAFNPNDIVITYDIVSTGELCYDITLYINGIPILTFPICNGAPGEKGDPGEDGKDFIPNLEVKVEKISELCRVWILYVNGEELLRDTICNGADGEDSQSNVYIDLPDFQEEFNNSGGTGHYLDKGWEFSDKVVVDQEDSPYGNGTVYLEDPSIGSGWARTPIFPWMTITFIEVFSGSNEVWEMDVYAQKRSNKEWIFLGTKVIGGTPNLLWYDQSTYGESFTYIIPSLEDSEYQDFERVEVNFLKVQGEKKEVECETDRNSSCNIPSIKVAGVRIIQE